MGKAVGSTSLERAMNLCPQREAGLMCIRQRLHLITLTQSQALFDTIQPKHIVR